MKKLFLILFVLIPTLVIAIKKPKIKIGINSYGYFKLLEEPESLYPSTLKDNIFFLIDETFSKFFRLKHRIDLYYSHYNKYNDNLEKLQGLIFNNTLNLYIQPQKNNQIQLCTKPMLYYKYGERYLKLMNKIQYRLLLKHFLFKTYYSHQYSFKPDELFYHNISLAFYWNFPKKKFMKFKTAITVYLQHYTDDKQKDVISPLKSARLNFEIAIDFNKIKFEDIFDKKENEDDFFEQQTL